MIKTTISPYVGFSYTRSTLLQNLVAHLIQNFDQQ